jgi:molybdopterin-guanine dinucleotide biosynthesis protein A
MIVRAAEALRPWVEELVVVSSLPVAHPPARVIPDRVADAGPLGGLDASLAEAERLGLDGVFLLACDLPLMSVELVGMVVAAAGDAPAVAPARTPDGVEPLCAVYLGAVRPAVDAHLGGPDRSLHALFRAVGGEAISAERLGVDVERALFNVNTPSDRDRAEGQLSPEEAG